MMKNDNFDISIHHVGGRCGTRAFPILPEKYEKCLENVLYEADTSCIEQMKTRLKESRSRDVIVPYCIAGHTGKADFYLLADRYESTLKKPEASNRFFANDFGWDHDISGVVDEVCQLDVIKLDDLYPGTFTEAAAPDFLSLDTEGTEPEILGGAENILDTKLLILQCEFDLENTCGKLQKIAAEYNFRTAEVQLANQVLSSVNPMPIGLRGTKGNCKIDGEIMFYKDPKHITEKHQYPELDLLKAAFIAFSQFHLQDMFDYLEEFKSLENSMEYLKQIQNRREYLNFLNTVILLWESYPEIVPMRYSTIFPTSQLRSARFGKCSMPETEELRNKYFQYVDRTKFKETIGKYFTDELIGMELLCMQAGFNEHAESIKKRRLRDTVQILSQLKLITCEDNVYKLTAESINSL